MKKEIKFSLVFRDMWQSAGKYVPTVDQLTRVALGQSLSTKLASRHTCWTVR